MALMMIGGLLAWVIVIATIVYVIRDRANRQPPK